MANEIIRVIVCVQGGVVQGARASVPVSFDVLDYDNLKDADENSEEAKTLRALEQEYDTLVDPIY